MKGVLWLWWHCLDCHTDNHPRQDGLVYQVRQNNSGEGGQEGNRETSGPVTSFCVTLADKGVVLLQHSGVALPAPVVLNPSTAPDDSVVVTNCLCNLPAEVFPVVSVSRAVFQKAGVLGDAVHGGFGGLLLMEEGVGTEGVLVAVALMTFYAASGIDETEEEEDACRDHYF